MPRPSSKKDGKSFFTRSSFRRFAAERSIWLVSGTSSPETTAGATPKASQKSIPRYSFCWRLGTRYHTISTVFPRQVMFALNLPTTAWAFPSAVFKLLFMVCIRPLSLLSHTSEIDPRQLIEAPLSSKPSTGIPSISTLT